MRGKLYSVGIGPGDPELMTLKSVRLLKECDVVAIPQGDNGILTAKAIVNNVVNLDEKEQVMIYMPMTKDMAAMDKAHREGADAIEKLLDEGKNVILDIEVQGARQINEKMPEAVKIFIIPPSMAELERRLRGRGTDTDRAIEARLIRARQEYEEADFYDYIIINDDAEKAAKELAAIITAENCRYAGREHYLKEE